MRLTHTYVYVLMNVCTIHTHSRVSVCVCADKLLDIHGTYVCKYVLLF